MAILTVSELIEELEGYDGDTEIRIALQPSWPLQYRLDSVVEAELGEDEGSNLTCDECGGDGCEQCGGSGAVKPDGETHKVLYLAEGGQVYDYPYLPGVVCKALGWR